jgi:DinB superfamily
MKNLLNELDRLIQSVPKIMLSISNTDYKSSPSKWSKKEILGHLCDSASMNHKRFIERLISKDEITLELYKQNDWVELNDYQKSYELTEVITLWVSLNKRIYNVLNKLTDDQWDLQYTTSTNEKVTLNWLFTDYIDHLKHHLNQIID